MYIRPSQPIPVQSLQYLATLNNTIITGDFNARHNLLGDTDSNTNGVTLANFLDSSPLIHLPLDSPTFIRLVRNTTYSSNPDHTLFTPNLNLVQPHATVLDDIFSDHLPILITFPLSLPHQPLPPIRTFYNSNKTDWPKFQTQTTKAVPKLANLPTDTTHNLDHLAEQISQTITSAFQTYTPLQQKRGFRPSLPPHIVNLIKQNRKTRRQVRQNPLLKTQLNFQTKQIRTLVSEHFTQAYIATTHNLDHTQGAEFWRKFKRLTNTLTSNTRPFLHNGQYYASNQEKANILAIVQEQICSTPNQPNFDQNHYNMVTNYVLQNAPLYQPIPYQQEDHDLQPFDTVNIHAIKAILENQKNTAPGPDQIPWPAIKHLEDDFLEILVKLFNHLLYTGHYPDKWKFAKIIYIPKPGKNHADPRSYRPISLLNTIAKLFDKVFLRKIRFFTNNNNIIPSSQYGFRHGRSCPNALLNYTQITVDAFNNRQATITTFLDIEKAYDGVWHDALIYKLHQFNYPLSTIRLIYNYLHNRSAISTYENIPSQPFPLSAGVPQGVRYPAIYLISSWPIFLAKTQG
jgi:hypothetical protein